MSEASDMTAIFIDIFSGLPRQGPGSDASTHKALAMCTDLPTMPTILDVGCGSGMQTLALANATQGHITAVEYHETMLNELQANLQDSPVASQITPQQGDMKALQFDEAQFDLIWSEGAIYIMGVASALASWKTFLKPDGYLAFSEAVWLNDNPHEAIQAFWDAEYPAMGTIEHNITLIQEAGYQLVGHFTLPDSDWWAHFYTHLENKLPALTEKYADNQMALGLLADVRRELAMRRSYGDDYSYEFYVCRLMSGA